jgi:hypothetical protein
MSSIDLLTFRVCVEKSAAILMGLSSHVIFVFPFCSFPYSFFVLYIECFDYDTYGGVSFLVLIV